MNKEEARKLGEKAFKRGEPCIAASDQSFMSALPDPKDDNWIVLLEAWNAGWKEAKILDELGFF